MISLNFLVGIVILLWVSIHTASFGVWTWKKKNKIGAVMVFIVAFSVLALPVYALYFSGQ